MTIKIFVLKGELNRKIVMVRFIFLSGILMPRISRDKASNHPKRDVRFILLK